MVSHCVLGINIATDISSWWILPQGVDVVVDPFCSDSDSSFSSCSLTNFPVDDTGNVCPAHSVLYALCSNGMIGIVFILIIL